MSETSASFRPSPSEEANALFGRGSELKNAGQFDQALTEFRRAAILDPSFFDAHMEIGRLCKDKTRLDRLYLRYTFEAFRQAAALDLTHEDAHNQYILAGQQMGQLDVLREQYDRWSKDHGDNDLLKRCYKNIITLSLAMIPERVDVADAKASGTLRRFLLIGCIGGVLLALALMFGPVAILRSGANADQIRGFFRIGSTILVLSIVGLIISSRLK